MISSIHYDFVVHNVISMLAFLMRDLVKDYHHHLVYISFRLHLDFMYAFVRRRERCFFVVFNTSKLLLFCISLSCVDGMSCFPFCIQIFVFTTTRLPQLPQSSLLGYIDTDLFILPPLLFSPYAFLFPPTSLLCSRE